MREWKSPAQLFLPADLDCSSCDGLLTNVAADRYIKYSTIRAFAGSTGIVSSRAVAHHAPFFLPPCRRLVEQQPLRSFFRQWISSIPQFPLAEKPLSSLSLTNISIPEGFRLPFRDIITSHRFVPPSLRVCAASWPAVRNSRAQGQSSSLRRVFPLSSLPPSVRPVPARPARQHDVLHGALHV
jgi:hypothetical protein